MVHNDTMYYTAIGISDLLSHDLDATTFITFEGVF